MAAYFVLGLLSTLGGELGSPKLQRALRLGNHIPRLSGWTWATIGLALLFVLGVEGALREGRDLRDCHARKVAALTAGHEKEAAALRRELKTVGQKQLVARFDLATEAEALSRDLFEFLAERKRDEPRPEALLLTDGLTEEDRQARWARVTDEINKFTGETANRYSQRFAGRALNVYDQAAEAGLRKPEKRWFVKNANNTHSIEDVAQDMSAIAYEARRR